MEELLTMVCGRRTEQVPAASLRELAEQYKGVVVDLGTGDVSYRAGRKPARGGLLNIRFIMASVSSLPAGLHGVADKVYVSYPWGSLLHAVLAPDLFVLRGVTAVLKSGGMLRVAINASVLSDAAVLGKIRLVRRSPLELYEEMRAGYNEAGLKVTTWQYGGVRIRSSWAGRLGQGPLRGRWRWRR